ncbi:hypothetical protein GGX14DRAFT_431586 [Mycena pura]|uniref:Uncharacterized protein n=1 Tax=Mycena pura TaxID=153505 RepID=A0AAD6YKJ9_9AGAR|nr:hypothetical protein GGX14DRAFT_431586 [Mycena pura]
MRLQVLLVALATTAAVSAHTEQLNVSLPFSCLPPLADVLHPRLQRAAEPSPPDWKRDSAAPDWRRDSGAPDWKRDDAPRMKRTSRYSCTRIPTESSTHVTKENFAAATSCTIFRAPPIRTASPAFVTLPLSRFYSTDVIWFIQ